LKPAPEFWQVLVAELATVAPVGWLWMIVLCLSAVVMDANLSLPIFIVAGVLLAIRDTSLRERKRDLKSMAMVREMSEDETHPQFPVEVTLLCGQFEFDRDIGCLSFIDGALYFSGERTTFSFTPRAARRPPRDSRSNSLEFISPSLEFFRHGLTYSVRFRSIESSPKYLALAESLKQWAGSRVKPDSVEVLPPTKPSAEAARAAMVRAARAIGVCLAVGSVPSLALWSAVRHATEMPLRHAPAYAVFLLVFVVAVVIGSFCTLHRDLASLRDLATEDAGFGIRRR
jgi:hypothetical protein